MTKASLTHPFDLDEVAQQFPGKLTFRGTHPGEEGETEVEGDVPEGELVAALSVAAHNAHVRLLEKRKAARRHLPNFRDVALGAAAATLALQLAHALF